MMRRLPHIHHNSNNRNRGYFLLTLFGFGIIIFLVILQLFRWQVIYHDKLVSLADAQIKQKQEIFTKRGTIYSADGLVFASDSPSWNVILSLVADVDRDKFFSKENFLKFKEYMENVIKVDPEIINNLQYSERLSFVVLKKGITLEQKKDLEKQKFIGIYTVHNNNRIYPNGTLASHVLGFVGKDLKGKSVGLYGIEGFFWGDIKGKDGLTQREKDLRGNAILSNEYQQIVFREGKNIVLTIRAGVQRKVEKVLAEKVKEFGAKRGAAIIMDPKTGEILAMAGYPTYNPNEYWKVKDLSVFKNPAVADVYEYGSIEKPLTISMALEEGVIDKNFVCNDTGKLKVLDKTIYNYGYKAFGKLTLKEVLEHSDNVCAAKIGLKVGAKNMYSYLHKLGIGSVMGIGLQDEETSFLKSPDKWNKVDVAVTSFGQMVSATPLQLISALSTIANNGKRMQPFLVKEIYNSEETIKIEPIVASQVFSADIAKSVAKMMKYATMKQGAWIPYRNIYSIAGKTGTAQIPKKDGIGYDEKAVNATFVAFVPAEDPVIIMFVKLERPTKYRLASLVAVPTWQAIFNAVKDDLGIPRVTDVKR